MTQSRTARHRGVQELSSPADLFKRGNYSLLRLLVIVNAAGPNGITTRKLLDKIRSHDTYTQRVLDRAQNQGLIERVKGEPPALGQFSPVYNIITERGKKLLQNHQLLY
jgi:DNA-binding MarR family transcriptional regulator